MVICVEVEGVKVVLVVLKVWMVLKLNLNMLLLIFGGFIGGLLRKV